jgi:RNA polymerase sigma-70 factor (ECF subfamily)
VLVGEPSDIDLVRQFQAGSVAAFDRIFLKYNKAISALTRRLVHDQLLAEDLAQETFFRVLRSLDRVDDAFNFSAWIHRIATNLCYDEMRRQKRGAGPQTEDGMRAGPGPNGGLDPDDVLRSLPSGDLAEQPEDALAMRELRREVWQVAAALPANYRTVLSLRELQGLSYNGIAEAMGVSESAIETLLHRARKRFKLEYLYLSVAESDGADRCDAVQELAGAFPLRSLGKDQRAFIRKHIDSCQECQAALAESA